MACRKGQVHAGPCKNPPIAGWDPGKGWEPYDGFQTEFAARTQARYLMSIDKNVEARVVHDKNSSLPWLVKVRPKKGTHSWVAGRKRNAPERDYRCSCGGKVLKIGEDRWECDECGQLYESDDWRKDRLKPVSNPRSRSIAKEEGGRGMILLGRKVTEIRTSSGVWRGNFGAIYGLRDGSVFIKGFYTQAPSGNVEAIVYADEKKAREEGVESAGSKHRGWEHKFFTSPRIFKVQGGLLVKASGGKPLWNVC